MKRINKILLETKRYFVSNLAKFLFLLIIANVISFLSKIPYLNLIFSFESSVIIFGIISIIVLRLSEKTVFYFALVFLILTPLFLISKNTIFAETTGDIAYFLLVIGFVQVIKKHIKELQKSEKK